MHDFGIYLCHIKTLYLIIYKNKYIFKSFIYFMFNPKINKQSKQSLYYCRIYVLNFVKCSQDSLKQHYIAFCYFCLKMN